MNISFVLLIILFILMTVVGGQRGVQSFFTLFLNFIILFFMIILIGARLDPIKVTVFGCIIISFITLFFINGFNIKTVSALLSVVIVVLLTMLMTYSMGNGAGIQGFGNEQSETISYLSTYVQLDFSKIVICQVLIGLLGAIIDVAISVSSSMYEIYKSDLSITRNNVLVSGMNIGKDILGTMTNTLLFAYIGGFMTLIIYFNELHYSLADILNAKVFCSEVFQILCGGIGIILIIPITAFITSRILFFKLPLRQQD
jgi:uncharacterized membrane protein